jgi:hypothetical protein
VASTTFVLCFIVNLAIADIVGFGIMLTAVLSKVATFLASAPGP